ncbi:hypothetical protein D3C79_805020 [compost metagenome]
MFSWQHHIGEGFQQHQKHRQQHGDQRHAEAWQVLLFGFTGDLVHQLLRRRAWNVAGDEVAIQWAGNDRCGQGDDQAIEDGLADVGIEDTNGQQRSGMRRHQTMDHRKPGQQRNTDFDQ